MTSRVKNLEIHVPIDATEIILTIKPQHASNIYAGTKKFELRKSLPKRIPKKVYLYESEEIKAITGHIIIDKVFIGKPQNILREISGKGIEEDRFQKYYDGYDYGCVYSIQNTIKYEQPIHINTLKEQFSFVIPQHFTYVDTIPKLYDSLNDSSMEEIIKNMSCEGINFSLLEDNNNDDFIKLVHSSISENYEGTGIDYPKKLISQFKGESKSSSFTSRKKFIFEINEDNKLCGYIVLTQKYTGSYKTAPFCLHEKYTNNKIGQEVRKLIHKIVNQHGGRKVYCTAPTSNKPALNYLLSANYQIEAHLKQQYHQDHDDIVYGYNLALAANIGNVMERKEEDYLEKKVSINNNQAINIIKEDLCKVISDYNVDIYVTKLLDRIHKSKEAFLLSYNAVSKIAIAVEKKTNNTVRIYIHARTFNKNLITKLLTTAELKAEGELQVKKFFITIDVLDFQLLPLVLEMGYRPEGIIRNYYCVGNDMMVISKIITKK